MIFNSIRWRLQAWHGLILVAVLAGFGFTAYQVAHDNQLRRIDQDLDQRLMALLRPRPPRARAQATRPPDEPPGRAARPSPSATASPARRPMSLARTAASILRTSSRACARRSSREACLDASQTNTFYYILWQGDGSVLARSPGAPDDVPAPERAGPP